MSSAHEDFSRAHTVQGSSNRAFGLVFAAVFAVVGLLPLWRGGGIRYWALGVAALLLAVSLVRPQLLGPANFLWTRLALVLNRVVSPVAMGVVFFLVATPTAILMRWFGKDPLRLRYDPAAKSYWLERTPPGPPPASMANQF